MSENGENNDLGLSFIKSVETMNTGGGCMIDILTMNDGSVLVTSDEYLTYHPNLEAFWESEMSQEDQPPFIDLLDQPKYNKGHIEQSMMTDNLVIVREIGMGNVLTQPMRHGSLEDNIIFMVSRHYGPNDPHFSKGLKAEDALMIDVWDISKGENNDETWFRVMFVFDAAQYDIKKEAK